jgi:hypothetical protein
MAGNTLSSSPKLVKMMMRERGQRSTILGRRGDPVHDRHDQVEQDDIGLETAGQFHGFGSVGRFTYDFDGQRGGIILQLQEGAQTLPDHGMIVHDQHPNRRRLCCV